MAVAYNLFGSGKTAVKAGLGRYVESLNTGYATSFGPGAAIVLQTNRTWGDTDGDFFPDCDLTNLGRNGECGPVDNTAFGQAAANTVPDSGFMNGFGKRQYNWQASVGVDHELRPGVAISATYYRRWFGNFTVTDNTLVTPNDYDPYCITAPTDSRLGSVSGSQICGLYDINPTKFGQVANAVGLAEKFGNPSEVYNGFDLNLAARFGKGGTWSGGWNIGNTFVSGSVVGTTFSKTDNCFVVDSPQQLYNCESQNPYQSRIKFNGSYPLPWDFRVAAVFQSLPAANYGANYTVSSAAIAAVAGTAARGRHGQRHDRPAAARCHVPRRADPAGGCASDEAVPIREPQDPGEPRRLQRVQQQHGPAGELDLRSELAEADADSRRPAAQVRRAGRFLTRYGCCSPSPVCVAVHSTSAQERPADGGPRGTYVRVGGRGETAATAFSTSRQARHHASRCCSRIPARATSITRRAGRWPVAGIASS